MKETRLIMGMPVSVEIADGPRACLKTCVSKACSLPSLSAPAGAALTLGSSACERRQENTPSRSGKRFHTCSRSQRDIEIAFDYFAYVDTTFSTYKKESEISRINRGEISSSGYSDNMREILTRAEDTKRLTGGYFDVRTPEGFIDPSGIVKGWAIHKVAGLLRTMGYRDFYVEAGGDIETSGKNASGDAWRIGICSPFDREQVVKVVRMGDEGIATSGTSIRGAHIYDPHTGTAAPSTITSISVIGPNVYEADRFATAAFAMGNAGIHFIERLPGFEGYAIDQHGIATHTSGFERYV